MMEKPPIPSHPVAETVLDGLAQISLAAMRGVRDGMAWVLRPIFSPIQKLVAHAKEAWIDHAPPDTAQRQAVAGTAISPPPPESSASQEHPSLWDRVEQTSRRIIERANKIPERALHVLQRSLFKKAESIVDPQKIADTTLNEWIPFAGAVLSLDQTLKNPDLSPCVKDAAKTATTMGILLAPVLVVESMLNPLADTLERAREILTGTPASSDPAISLVRAIQQREEAQCNAGVLSPAGRPYPSASKEGGASEPFAPSSQGLPSSLAKLPPSR